MVKINSSEDFKRDAVHPLSGSGLPANHEKKITVRGYPVREVSRRLGVSTHSLYKWLKLFAVSASKAVSVDHEGENRCLKRELARMTEERDILKKAAAYFAQDAK
jgi:transposase